MRDIGCDEERTFELLLRVEVDLLRLCDLLQDVLDDQPVVVAHFAVKGHVRYEGECLRNSVAHLGVNSI